MIKNYKALPSINSRKIVCLITSLIWQAVSSGQELQLFEETETSSRVEEIPRSSQVRRDGDGNIISGPEFVLVGTTRIGGDFFVVLEDNTKELISISLTEGSSRSISGYPGYEVTYVGSGGEVSIRYPGGHQCIEFVEQGVTCISTSEANLSLTNAQPLNLSASDQRAEPAVEGEELVNPLRQSCNGVQTLTRTQTSIVLLALEELILVMSSWHEGSFTPFGDRLVEEDE